MPLEDSDSGDEDGGYSFPYEPGANQLTTAMVEGVTRVTETDEVDFDPIAHTIDPDA